MHFKTHQTLALAGINDEKLRHWKSQLSPLSGFDGRKQGFSIEQVVALAVINRFVSGLKIPVAALAPQAEEIFEAVARHLAGLGDPLLLWIDNTVLTGAPGDLPDVDALIIIRLDRVAEQVRADAVKAAASQLSLI